MVDDVEPADFAEEKWKLIKNILNSCDSDIGFVQFYRHFWISKYKRSGMSKLYDDFKSVFGNKGKSRYKEFLTEIEATARLYVKIVAPQRNHFKNKKEYFGVVQSLNALTNYFNIVQVRVALIALLEAKDKGIINLTQLKKVIYYLENFHFSFNAVGAQPTNKLESIYSAFAIKLRASNDKVEARTIINALISELDGIYIPYKDFEEKFVLLTYTKKENISNLKTKYAINKIASYYEGKEVFEDDGSVEHILPESADERNLNIGNLILLEQTLNGDADDFDYCDKIEIYEKSQYKWIKTFIESNVEWDNEKSEQRAKELAKFYYTKILGKTIPANSSN